MTAFERELMQRLNHAGVNVKSSVSADQLRRIDKKLRNAEAAAGRTPHLSMSLDIRSLIASVAACCMGFMPGAEDRNASLATYSGAFCSKTASARESGAERVPEHGSRSRLKCIFIVVSPAASKASRNATRDQTSKSADDVSFMVFDCSSISLSL